jgi:hypothetical protein
MIISEQLAPQIEHVNTLNESEDQISASDHLALLVELKSSVQVVDKEATRAKRIDWTNPIIQIEYAEKLKINLNNHLNMKALDQINETNAKITITKIINDLNIIIRNTIDQLTSNTQINNKHTNQQQTHKSTTNTQSEKHGGIAK